MRALCLALCIAPAASLAAAGPVTLELRPQVRVAPGAVTLGQVAILTSSDLDAMRALVDLPIGRAPGAGQGAVLERSMLAAWIRRRTGITDDRLQWLGPQATEIGVAQRLVLGDEIARAAEATLRAWLATQAPGSAAELDAMPRDVAAPEGELRLRVRPLTHAALRQRMLVWVEVWAADQFVRALPVAFQLAGVGPLPALDTDARAPLAVQRGQWGSLRSAAGAVLSEARVEVLQDGRLGDRVRVRQAGAPATLLATVTGAGQLEIAR